MESNVKRCSACKEQKPVECFSKNRARKDGLHNQCKSCQKAANRKYREENREKEREKCRKYHKENREKVRERKRKHYEENREKERERGRKYLATPEGFLVQAYCSMRRRTRLPKHRKDYKYYAGIQLKVSKEDFINWSLTETNFLLLLEEYLASGNERRLAPSVDRIDPDRHYELGNIQWITQGENTRKAHEQKKERQQEYYGNLKGSPNFPKGDE